MSERIFRYVLHSERARYEREGWVFAAYLGPSHGCYSVLMEQQQSPTFPQENAAKTRQDVVRCEADRRGAGTPAPILTKTADVER
jgi:hypothetical protein